MIRQTREIELDLESFAQEAAERVAQFWSERACTPLSAAQKRGLVDGIWECLLPENLGGIETEASHLMHAT